MGTNYEVSMCETDPCENSNGKLNWDTIGLRTNFAKYRSRI